MKYQTRIRIHVAFWVAVLVTMVVGLAASAHAATFNQFGPATGILKGASNTPITTAATSSDVIATWSGVCSSSTYLRGDGTCASVAPTGAALTKTDDTNVTLTLGGTPTTALLQSTSLTLGWTGTLGASRGGLGMSTVTDDTLAVANGSIWQSKAIPDCDTATSVLQYDTSTNAFSCGTNASPAGAALTRVDDTNVTLTLGGSPTTALVNAASITAGWTGQLSAARGGTGISTVTDDTVLVANGSAWQSKALTDCDAATSAVTYDVTTNAWGCNTINGATGANPTGTVGLSAVNGVATTFLRSDGAPALSQAIAPTWTGNHVFSPSNGVTRLSASNASLRYTATSAPSNTGVWDITSLSSTGALTFRHLTDDEASSTAWLSVLASGTSTNLTSLTFGNASNPSYSFLGSGTANVAGAVTIGSPTGGAQGTGTINAAAVYDDGVLLANASGANPTGTIGLSAVNGSAGTFLRSDGAPALSQSITPTWTGQHVYTSIANGGALRASNVAPYIMWTETDQGADAQNWRWVANSTQFLMQTMSDDYANARTGLAFARGSGYAISGLTFGNSTDNPTYAFSGSGAFTAGGDTVFSGRNFSAGGSGSTAVQLCHSGSGYGQIGINVSCQSGGGENYASTDVAGHISFSAGTSRQWRFETAASGTGGTGITWTSQATLNSAGDLATAGKITSGGDIRAIGTAAPLRMNAADSTGDNYLQAYSSDGTTERWFIGNGGSSDNNLSMGNNVSGASTTIQTTGSGTVLLNPGASTVEGTVTAGGGLQMGSPTGGDQGAGTINATGLYINGVPVSGGATSTGSFTATQTGLTAGVTCSMKYRLTGTMVFLYNTANCLGTSNATTFTFTGLPTAIRPNRAVSCITFGQQDNGVAVVGAADIGGGIAAGTVQLDKNVVSGSNVTVSASNWTNSGTKGLTSVWTCIYDLDS